MAFMGPQILMADVVLWPSRSIIKQSYDARERRNDSTLPFHLGYGNLNGDGFGIGWFAPETSRQDPSPCTFTSVTPAWNNENLNRLATKLESGLIFAHVRAAYPGMPVSEQNCHPFQWGRYLFMHNGVIAGFMDIRRQLLACLSDAAYNAVQSFHSDSAVSFAIFLNHLPDMNVPQPPAVILKAIQDTISKISAIQKEAGIPASDTSLLNFIVSDGTTLVATRYVSNEKETPASLYFAEGSSYGRSETQGEVTLRASALAAATVRAGGGDSSAVGQRSKAVTGEGDYTLINNETGTRVVLIASEPVTSNPSDWVEVPTNTALVVVKERDGLLTTIQAPLSAQQEAVACLARQEEVVRCLEAVTRLAGSDTSEALLKLANNNRKSLIPSGWGCWHCVSCGGTDSMMPYIKANGKGSSTVSLGKSDSMPPLSMQDEDTDAEGSDAVPAAPPPDSEEHLLTGHTGSVTSLILHDQILITGSADCNIRVWSLHDSKLLAVLVGHQYPVRALSVMPASASSLEGKKEDLLISVGAKTVRIWDMSDWSCVAIRQVCDISGSAKCLTIDAKKRLYVGGQDCKVRCYETEPLIAGGSPLAGGNEKSCSSPCIMSQLDTARAVIGSAVQPASCTSPAHAHCASVNALAVMGGLIFSASSDSTIKVWRAGTLEFVKTLRGHRGSVLALYAGPGILVSGGRDRLIRVWDLDTLVCRRTLSGHHSDVLWLAGLTVPVPPIVTTGSGGGSLNGNVTATAAAGSSSSSNYSNNEMMLMLASSSADGTVRIWSTQTYVCLKVLGANNNDNNNARSIGLQPVLTCAMNAAHVAGALPGGNVRVFSIDDLYCKAIKALEDSAGLMLAGYGGRLQIMESSGNDKEGEGTPPTKRARRVTFQESTQTALIITTNSAPKDTCITIEKEFERALRSFVRIRSVSADPSLREESFKGAKFLLRLLESLGAEVKLAQPYEDKNPLVIARLGRDPNKPTVLFYGHYDVQPTPEPEWKTDPFELTIIDGHYFGRGVSDNKGPILAFIFAVKELLSQQQQGANGANGTAAAAIAALTGNSLVAAVDDTGNRNGGTTRNTTTEVSNNNGLPVNVAFLFEGEEENGSTGFREAVHQNISWFEDTSLIVISNTLWVGETVPCITYGMRGMINLSIEIKGPSRDLHSGNEGGVFSEPLADLSKLLASLVDGRATILVPGFYGGVRPNMLSAALPRLQNCAEFSMEGYQKALGVPELTTGRSVPDLLESRWCRPTMSVVDVRVGTADATEQAPAHYRFGPTRFSVIPKAAVGKVSVRYVPDQNADQLVECLTAHVHHEFGKLRSGNEVSVTVHSIGDWWEADPDSSFMRIAEKVTEIEWGQKPLLVREGGTMPVASALEKILKAPALLLPLGQSSDNVHLANERIGRVNLMRGKDVVRGLLTEIGRMKK
jgi:Cys-Gly metallodipeptidase DUG1